MASFVKYVFEDGYFCWARGLSRTERGCLERQHGRVVEMVVE